MKKSVIRLIILCFVNLFLAAQLHAQAPAGFKYQSVLRRADGTALANQNVSVRISILRGSLTGSAVYSETHGVTTNGFGIINLNIGEGGSKSGNISTINWGSDTYFIKVEMDEAGGNSYALSGTSQLLSVPYALYATNAGNGFYGNAADTAKYLKKETDPVFTASVAKSIKASDTARWSASGNFNSLYNCPVNYNSVSNNLAIGFNVLEKNTSGLYNTAVGGFSLITNTIGSKNTSLGGYSLQDNVSGSYNTAIGFYSLRQNTTGNSNTAVGESSLQGNISGVGNTALGAYTLMVNTSGKYNVAIGIGAMYRNTYGEGNVACGPYSLHDNTSGYNNVAVGYSALTKNTTAWENTAVGLGAMANNTTGIQNTSVGFRALSGNISGKSNNAFGVRSLWGNTSGNWNVAIGDSALLSNIEGSKNVAIGYKAMFKNIRWDNVAVGFYAMVSNTEGFDNTAVGMTSMSGNTTGVGNTAVGKNALSANKTGSNNTAIGFKANVNDGLTNATAIGYDALANSSNKIVLGNSNATSVGGYGSWSNFSDRRLKENIRYRNDLGLDFILKLKPASYNYTSDTNKNRRDGFIAQDVQKALQELGIDFSGLIVDDDIEKTLNLAYADFVIPLVKAVQQQQQQISDQQAQIEELKKMVLQLMNSK